MKFLLQNLLTYILQFLVKSTDFIAIIISPGFMKYSQQTFVGKSVMNAFSECLFMRSMLRTIYAQIHWPKTIVLLNE